MEQIIGPGSHSNRLTFALAACAQVPLISADKRCWIFRKLKSILVSDVAPPVDVPALIGCGEYKDDVPSIFKHKSTGDAKTKEVLTFYHRTFIIVSSYLYCDVLLIDWAHSSPLLNR